MPPLERLKRRRSADPATTSPTPLEHAQQLDWPGEAPRKRFMPMLRRALEEQSDARVLVVAGPELQTWQQLFARAWPRIEPVLVDVTEDESEAHVRLALAGPFDVVLLAADTAAVTQSRWFSRVFFHLREGGVFLTPVLLALSEQEAVSARAEAEAWIEEQRGRGPLPNEDGALVPPYVGELWDVVAEAQRSLLREPEGRPDRGPRTLDVHGLARHLREVHVHGASLRIVNARRTHAKLREPEADVVLAARPELGREIESMAPTRLTAAAEYLHNLERDDHVWMDLTVPKLTLRAYDAPVCSRGQVVTSGDFVWPDTYRHHLAPRLRNYFVEDEAALFGHLRRDASKADPLPGAWFNLDSEFPGHYGHMLTELLGRMWAWDRVRELAPDVRCLMTLQRDREPQRLLPWELDVLGAFGIRAEDVHVFDAPCRPETLYSATSMFSLADYVHPGMVEVWDRVGDHLATGATPGERPRRIFCTRPTDHKRSCANTDEVEDVFERHGFEVVRPETLPLPDQVALFRSAEVIAGFGGSALFTAALCDTPKTLVTVAPTSYTARNEHLIAAARGHRIISAWSEPDLQHPEGWWTQEAYSSGFTFDHAREGAWLEDRLSELGEPA